MRSTSSPPCGPGWTRTTRWSPSKRSSAPAGPRSRSSSRMSSRCPTPSRWPPPQPCASCIRFQTVDTIVATEKGMPAAGVLSKGEVITAVNGQPVGCRADPSTLLRRVRAGTTVELTIRRGSQLRRIRIRTTQFQGYPVIGVQIVESFVFPFAVKINIGNIGGPSAGLMFALGIIDKLGPVNLTGGRFIAGTGEIEPNGTVQPIGGIQQKMVGARSKGATVFLTPAANCQDAAGAVPAGMRLIKVSTLAGAVSALEALKAGRPTPAC